MFLIGFFALGCGTGKAIIEIATGSIWSPLARLSSVSLGNRRILV